VGEAIKGIDDGRETVLGLMKPDEFDLQQACISTALIFAFRHADGMKLTISYLLHLEKENMKDSF
jgi:hypothetical protein